MKRTVVIFSEHNARVLRGVEDGEWDSSLPHLVNPDITPVRGAPPHLWCIEDGKLAVLPPKRLKERVRHWEGVHHLGLRPNPSNRWPGALKHVWLYWAFIAGCAVGAAAILLLR